MFFCKAPLKNNPDEEALRFAFRRTWKANASQSGLGEFICKNLLWNDET